nr:MAG TPA: hypothetical protein [Caudoviricetes sp.]
MLNSTQQHSARLSIDAQPAELPAPKSQKPPRNLDVSPLRTQVQLLRGEPIPCPRFIADSGAFSWRHENDG